MTAKKKSKKKEIVKGKSASQVIREANQKKKPPKKKTKKQSQAEIESKAGAFDKITSQAEVVTTSKKRLELAKEIHQSRKKDFDEDNETLLQLINDSKQSFPLFEGLE